MSEYQYTGNEVVTGRVPLRLYQARVLEVKYGPNKKQNPMFTIETEIMAPDKVEFGGEVFSTAGVKATMYVVVTPKSAAKAFQTLKALGITLTPGESLDTIAARVKSDLPNSLFKAMISSKPRYLRQELTPQDIAAGKDPYEADPVVDEETGQPVIDGWQTEIMQNSIKFDGKI